MKGPGSNKLCEASQGEPEAGHSLSRSEERRQNTAEKMVIGVARSAGWTNAVR